MDFLIYRSHALIGPESEACREILAASQRNNAKLGVTGYLHFEDGMFMQYLEGPAAALQTLYQRIVLDPRHCDVEQLGYGPTNQCLFRRWSMGFSDDHVASFRDFLNEAWGKTDPKEADAREAALFLTGACQRMDLGITN